jgi:hypothetical protein
MLRAWLTQLSDNISVQCLHFGDGRIVRRSADNGELAATSADGTSQKCPVSDLYPIFEF